MSEPTSRPGLTFVVNPASGRKRGRDVADRVRARITNRVVRDTDTRPGDDGPRQVEFCGSDDCVLFGGDGTANKFVNAMGSSRVPVAFFGGGTINVLSRALGIPQEVDAFAEMLQARRTVDVPIARVGGGLRFLMFYEIGFMGRIVSRVNAWRDRHDTHGKFEFIAFTVWELFKLWPRRYSVAMDDDSGVFHGPYSNVLVTRVREDAGTMPMPVPDTIANPILERQFQVVGYRTRWFGTSLLLLLCAAMGLLPLLTPLFQKLGFLETFRAARIRIDGSGPAGACQTDAETVDAAVPHELGFEDEPLPMYVP